MSATNAVKQKIIGEYIKLDLIFPKRICSTRESSFCSLNSVANVFTCA